MDKKQFGILQDEHEYWKYIKSRGNLYFVICTYYEKQHDLKESNLLDEFSITKSNVSKIQEIFNIVEKEFKVKKEMVSIDSYRIALSEVEYLIPSRNLAKMGKNFRIEFVNENKNIQQLNQN